MVTSRAREWWAQHRPGRRQPVTLALMLALAAVLLWVFWDRAQAEERAELSEGNAQHIAEEVRDACRRQGEVARRLGDICRQAEEVAAAPAEPVVATPSDEQLRPLVQQYVAAWLAANPPPPGRDGRDAPSLSELTDVIMREIAVELERNPPPAGEDGESVTPEQLRPIVVEEVAAHLEANPPPPGEDGEDGQDGADGADGEPPESWTFTTCDALGQCTEQRCERAEDFDPDAPRYECEPVEDEEE